MLNEVVPARSRYRILGAAWGCEADVIKVGLWGAFMLADEFFKEYDTERTHVQLFIAQPAAAHQFSPFVMR
jgi:hypothetical protein